jgi:SAM-dependent methyltransferase
MDFLRTYSQAVDVSAAVSRVISDNDAMFEAGNRNLDSYLRAGREAFELLTRYSDSPQRVLDFGCGHGRVLRHMVAEWPEAEVWACDLDPDAVDFCKKELGARGIVSTERPADLTLPRFDLIWVGSVFTHLEPRAWNGFLSLLADSLEGILALSLEGPAVAEHIRNGEEMGVGERAEGLLNDFDSTGFAFRDYLYGRRKGYGLVLCSPEHARTQLESLGLQVVAHEPCAWMGRQDVVIAARRG